MVGSTLGVEWEEIGKVGQSDNTLARMKLGASFYSLSNGVMSCSQSAPEFQNNLFV